MSILTDYQKKALQYDKHISLTANAGSGKTTVLARRYVEILLNENIGINNIVAITFTDKAASELYSKIAKEINNRLAEKKVSKSYKLESIRRSLVSAKISTIHSFCIEVLKDYAPEAGIDANFLPVDERIAEDLLNQSIDEIITSHLYSNSKIVKKLIRIFGNKSQLIKAIKTLFGKRKTIEHILDNIYNNEENIAGQLHIQFVETCERLFGESINIIISNITSLNKLAGEYKLSEKQIEINRLLKDQILKKNIVDRLIQLDEIRNTLLTNKGNVYKRGYLSGKQFEDNSALIEETEDLLRELSEIKVSTDYNILNSELAEFGKELALIYSEINERYTSKKRYKAYLDFEDLLLITQELLQKETIINDLSEKFKYIMIDEYQDTNETQYNIFMPILKNLAVGNLFVVGDEKQSIYMFREAEVELFNRTRLEIENSNDFSSILGLPHSFRLSPNIALFINILFRNLFKDPNPNFNEVSHNDLVCAYQKSQSGDVEFLIADDEIISEAELTARKIIMLAGEQNSKYKFSDITILCNKRKSFAELEKIFSLHSIPFTIVGGKGFFQQQLVFDIYNYLSFLINPADDLALAAILRGPFYVLSDIEITEVNFLKGKTLYCKLKSSPNYKNIVELLEDHIQQAKISRPNELIRKICNDTGFWFYLSGKMNGAQEIANLEKLIKRSIGINEQGFNSLYDFISYLKDSIENLEDEGQAEIKSNDDTVKIMTIHQSKGLEFKVVILYNTNQKMYDERLKAKSISIDKDFGIMAKLPPGENYFAEYKQAPVIGLYNYVQKKKAEAEFKRLLYVALTRAEEYLIISMNMPNEKIVKDSFADMILSTFSSVSENDQIKLEDEIAFMKLDNDKYITESKKVEYLLKLVRYIEPIKAYDDNVQLGKENKYSVDTRKIFSTEKNEIISASKISLFLNCPKKYELTYEFGYGELTKLFRESIDFEFSYKEEENSIPGNIVGNIVHEILAKNSTIDKIDEDIKLILNHNESDVILNPKQKDKLFTDIKEIIGKYYSSNSYERLREFGDSFNEIEFYKKENDYYLYGIIDKLIVSQNKIRIVDYKSDKVNSANFTDKKNTYLNQLMFYAYLLTSKYPDYDEFELNLIFLRDDSFSYKWDINKTTILTFGEIISQSVIKIRNGIFSEQAEGCQDMKYYLLS